MANVYCYHRDIGTIGFVYEIEGVIYLREYMTSLKKMSEARAEPSNGKTLEEHAKIKFSNSGNTTNSTRVLELTNNNPGKYHPRIYRPGFNEFSFKRNADDLIVDKKALAQSVVVAKILLDKLSLLFETISPYPSNENSFGHEIRNLLLLAAMEVESSWSGILKANGYSGNRWSTNDYVKLLKPLYLDKYGIRFISHPDLPVIKPFENWDIGNPTTSLFWYDNYNKTKHDRESNLNIATLKNAIYSVGGVIALLHAQFGPNHNFWNQGEFLNIQMEFDPEYLTKDYYIPHSDAPLIPCKWEEINYSF